jgi:hypothetical protein
MRIKAVYISILFLFIAGLLCPAGILSAKDQPDIDKATQQAIWEYKHENYEEALELLKKLRK